MLQLDGPWCTTCAKNQMVEVDLIVTTIDVKDDQVFELSRSGIGGLEDREREGKLRVELQN